MPETRPRYRSIISDNARWEEFPFREGDIVISTPPKCGTTWMQMLCGLLVFQEPKFERPLAEISPWLDMTIYDKDDVFPKLAAQKHRRFIKTHTPVDGIPQHEHVTYVAVGRDPRDVAISWDYHFANLELESLFATLSAKMGWEEMSELAAQDPPPTGETLVERFWHWVDNPAPPERAACSLRTTLHHFDVALRAADRPNVVVFHYGDLKADLEGEMRRLADRLGIAVPETLWPELLEAASFDRMRERAVELAPNSNDGFWKDIRAFFHSGRGGHWREFFGAEERSRYEKRVGELARPELAAWAHGGWGGAGGAR